MDHDTIELHTMVPAWSLPTFTPFGLKLIAYLRMANIPYRIVVERDPARGPTRKFPWLVDGATRIGDSSAIVQHLVARYGDRVDAWLSAQQSAAAHAIRRMVEEGFCFVLLHLRWVDDSAYDASTSVMLQGLPALARSPLRRLIRRRILRDLWGQGITRLDPKHVMAIGRSDLDALENLLGDGPFLFGARPCSADASVAAFLAVLLVPPLENELKSYARELPRLAAYAERTWHLYFESADSPAVR